ncbi:MAG TPA: polysaccharide biosynthesis C-terminal domain-containing protein [Bryobacteraceae bacterium]
MNLNLTSSRDSLARNIATNFLNYGFVLVSAFIMLPIMIGHLGAERYGLWILAGEIVGYLAFLDLGVRSAAVYFGAGSLARRDSDELNRVAATAFWSLAILGAAFSALCLAVVHWLPSLFKVSGVDVDEARWSVLWITVTTAVTLLADVLTAILNGRRRLDLVNVIDTASRAAGFIATVIFLYAGYGLVAVSLAQLGMKVLLLVLTRVALAKVVPGLSLSPGYLSLSWLIRLCRFGMPSLLINLGQAVNGRTDLILVGMFLGVRMVTFYSIPRNLMEYAFSGVRSITTSYTAHLLHLSAENRTEDLLRLYESGARLSGIAICLLTAYISAFGSSFLRIWQGPVFVTGVWDMRADVALLILAAAFLPRMAAHMSTQLLFATGRLAFTAWSNAAEAAAKVALSFVLVPRWGLAGMAIANLIPMYLVDGFATTLYLLRIFPLSVARFMRNVVARPLAVGLAAFAVSWLLVRWKQPLHWPVFLLEAAFSALCGIAVTWKIALENHELMLARDFARKIRSKTRGT